MTKLRPILPFDTLEIAVTPAEVKRRLRLSEEVIKALMVPRQGGGLLPTISVKKRSEFLVTVEGIEDFSRTYVSLIGLGRELGMHHFPLLRNLNAARIQPIDDPTRLKARIYRRSEVPTAFLA